MQPGDDTQDRIELIGIRATGHHGVLPEEREAGQEFEVDVTLRTDTRRAAASDVLGQTVDYSAVAREVHRLIEGAPVQLIETLADRIAGACLAFDRVTGVDVTVHKPHAPVGVPFADVIVRITRP